MQKFRSNFKVTAPATIANLVCGFDSLGLALESPHEEILVNYVNKPGIHIQQILNNPTKISTQVSENAAGISAQLYLDFLKKEQGLDKDMGLDFIIHKKVPVGFGLGSSSSSAVAGVMAVNEAFDCPLTKRELIPFAVAAEKIIEGHVRINSIVPCMLGGIMLTRDHASLDYHRLPSIKGLHIVVIYPKNIKLYQQEIRAKLSPSVALKDSITQSANLGSFVQSLYMADLDLMSRSLQSNFLEQELSVSIPYYLGIKNAALENNALACSVAGKGSAIFAICKNSLEAENVADAMKAFYSSNKIRSTVLVSKIDHEGATLA